MDAPVRSFRASGGPYGFLNPFIIAEIGVNHEGSLSRAESMVRQAAAAGTSAVKFQTYEASKLASKLNSPGYWDFSKESTKSQFELFSKYPKLSSSDYQKLANLCDDLGILFMTTCFDEDSLNQIDPLVSLHKVSSSDITNIPLLRAVAEKAKPVILSAGAASASEIKKALGILLDSGAKEIALLHCVLSYPTKAENANLGAIQKLRKEFESEKVCIGYSDHVSPVNGEALSLEMASLLGAVVIEKHFSDLPGTDGNDHYHSVGEQGLRSFSNRLENYRRMLGNGEIDLDGQQLARNNARRRICAKTMISQGERLSSDSLVPLRADKGIVISEWDRVVGAYASRDILPGTPLRTSDLVGWDNV